MFGHDEVEVEAAVLGAGLNENPHAASFVCTKVNPAWLYRESHRVVLTAMRELFERGESVVTATVAHRLRSAASPSRQFPSMLEFIGGDLALINLLEHGCMSAQLPSYVGLLEQMAEARDWQCAGKELVRITETAETVDELRRRCAEAVTSRLQIATASHAGVTTRTGFEERYTAAGGPGIPMPILSLNRAGGLRPGGLTFVGGLTGHGKTWWELDQIEIAAELGVACAVFTMEMSIPELEDRLLAMGGHDLDAITMKTAPVANLTQRLEQMESWPVTYFDGPCTVQRIISECMRAKMRGRPFKLVGVDHLHLMEFPGRDYRLAVNQGVAELKVFAQKEGIHILLLGQLRRRDGKISYGGETFETSMPVPRLSDLRESSALEQIADYVLFVYRFPNKHDRLTMDARIIVAKQRTGTPIRSVKAVWSDLGYRFQPTDASDMIDRVPGGVHVQEKVFA